MERIEFERSKKAPVIYQHFFTSFTGADVKKNEMFR